MEFFFFKMPASDFPAGLAVGLTLAVNTRYPGLAPIVSTVVLASVAAIPTHESLTLEP